MGKEEEEEEGKEDWEMEVSTCLEIFSFPWNEKSDELEIEEQKGGKKEL